VKQMDSTTTTRSTPSRPCPGSRIRSKGGGKGLGRGGGKGPIGHPTRSVRKVRGRGARRGY